MQMVEKAAVAARKHSCLINFINKQLQAKLNTLSSLLFFVHMHISMVCLVSFVGRLPIQLAAGYSVKLFINLFIIINLI